MHLAKETQFTWEDIYNSSLNLLFPLTLEETYKTAVLEAKKLLHAEHGTLLREQDGVLRRVYATHDTILNADVSQTGRTMQVFTSKEPLVSIFKSKQEAHEEIWNMGIRSAIFIPLSYEDRVVGVMNIMSKKNFVVRDETFLMLKLFGALISQAIYKADEYKRTEEAVLVRDLFIAMASHELKTPLTSIMLYAELIKKQTDKNMQPRSVYVEILLKQSKLLSNLINDILQTHTLKQKKLHYSFEKVSIIQVIEVAISTLRVSFAKYSFTFQHKLQDAYVYGDFYKLVQVITNILNNAVKFSQPSVIKISLRESKRGFSIIIRDQGKGIAAKDLPHIFDEFYKGGQKQQIGMGLGMYLVKNILDSHKGTIHVASKLHKGTKVTIILPTYDSRT